MNKPLNQYVSEQEICCELEHVFHYRLSKMIGANTDIIYNMVTFDRNNQMSINITPYVSGIIRLCKWKYITYLQNNGIQNTQFEKYILNLNVNASQLIEYQLNSGNYLTTYVM